MTNIGQVEGESKTTTLIGYFNQLVSKVKMDLQLGFCVIQFYYCYDCDYDHDDYDYYYYLLLLFNIIIYYYYYYFVLCFTV